MIVVAIVLLVVAVGLAVELVRTRGRVEQARAEVDEAVSARTAAEGARRRAEADVTTMRRERDDALEREKRAKREASEVARRLKAEHEARAAAESARQVAEAAQRTADEARRQAEASTARLEDDLASAEAAVVAGGPGDTAELWALALAGVRRTWDVSVAPSPGTPSPLEGAEDELRAAVGIEVDAAREEAGADIDLEWVGDVVAPPAVALRALSIAQELIARLAKISDHARLRVTSDAGGVSIEVEGTDVEGHSVVPADVAGEHQVGPGRYLLTG